MNIPDSSSPLDPRAKRWGLAARYLALLGIGFIVAPYVFTAITGIVGLAAAAALLGACWMLTPWLQAKAANMRLKLIKHEAAQNPVETLQNEHLRKSEELQRRREGVEAMSGTVRAFAASVDEIQAFNADDPQLPQMREDLAELKALEKQRYADLKEGYVLLDDFKREIQRAGLLWKASLAAARARQATGLTEGEWQAELKTKTSFEAIRTSLDQQLASLSVERVHAEAQAIVRNQSGQRKLRADPQQQQPPTQQQTTSK